MCIEPIIVYRTGMLVLSGGCGGISCHLLVLNKNIKDRIMCVYAYVSFNCRPCLLILYILNFKGYSCIYVSLQFVEYQ
jgi:hypothetical protein